MPEYKKKPQTFTNEELQGLLEKAAQEGARKALAELGLHDEYAGKDIQDLRSLIGSFRAAKNAFWKTILEKIGGAAAMLLIGYLLSKYGVHR